MTDPKAFFTSESVTEGHPDKLCDQISDGVLDAMLRDDPMARVACEAATTTGLVLVAGEITTTTYVDISAIVRETIRKVGYVDANYGFDYRTCGVTTAIGKQSPDIDRGVSASLEYRERMAGGELTDAVHRDQRQQHNGQHHRNEDERLTPLFARCQRLARHDPPSRQQRSGRQAAP